MNNTEVSSLVTEFQQTYERTETPALPERLSGYRFVSCLADSGQKKAWLLEKANGQKVLCKYAAGEYVEMLRTESCFDSLGKFPFVPYVFSYFETEGNAYLLREYIEGPTLSDLVERDGPLPLNRAIPIIEQVCAHLSRLHESDPPIIYRDLKPSNVVLHPSGDCYLIDMGTVRTYHEDHSLDTVFIGTVDTAAPEQFGARQTDNRTDIYALGVLFYYLLTGEVKIQKNKLKKLPARAAAVIRKCTAFDPDDRYPQISRVVAALHPSARFKLCITAILASFCTAAAILAFLPLYHSIRGNSVSENRVSDNSLPDNFISEGPEVENPIEVVFSSPLLEQAVRTAVGKTDGEPVYEEDLVRVTRIYICGDTVFGSETEHDQYPYTHNVQGKNPGHGDISDISLLAKMPNLHHVVLDYQQIYDLSPLADLQLVSLSLCGNPIAVLSALEDQTVLTDLDIAETDVTSLGALRECSVLSTLDCSYCPVISLEPLALLPIHTLCMFDTPARDFEALCETPLQNLYCNNVPVEYFDSIGNIPTLLSLTIYGSGITSLKELSGLTGLSRLDVHGNRIKDLDGLEQFTNLKDLSIGANPITDLSPLTKMDNLSILAFNNTVTDFSFLNEMPWLTFITVSPSEADALYEAVPDPWFEVSVF